MRRLIPDVEQATDADVRDAIPQLETDDSEADSS